MLTILNFKIEAAPFVMARYIFKSLFILFCFSIQAQQEVADYYNYQDSIKKIRKQIELAQNPKVKVERLIRLSLFHLDNTKALEVLDEAQEIAIDLNDTLLIADIALTKAGIYQYVNDNTNSTILFDSFMPLYKKHADEEDYYKTEFQYTKVLYASGRYYDALETALGTYNYFVNQSDEVVYSGLLSSTMGSIYKKLDRHKDAIEMYENAIEFCLKAKHFNCAGGGYDNLALLYLEMDEIEKAEEANGNHEEVIKDEPPLQWHYGSINLTSAKILIAKNEPDRAIKVLMGYLEKIKTNNIPKSLASYYYQLSRAYLLNNDYFNAMRYSNLALEIANNVEAKAMQESIHLTNSYIFEKMGKPSKALESLRNHNSIKESLLSKDKIAQLNELEAKYKAAVSENKINKLEKDNALKALQIQKGNQKKLIWTSAIFVLLLGLMGLVYILRKKSKMNVILEEKNAIITKNLEDKDILLREIHHRVKNNLQVVSSLLNLQSNYISDDIALEAITEGKNRVSSMALIHQNLYREENLTSINSKEYFDDLVENLFDSYNINQEKIQLKKQIDNLDIDVDTMIPLGLIVNELVTNSLKHAFNENENTGVIDIVLKEEDGALLLVIADNGVGISESEFLSSNSFGNKMIKAFKQKLGASIKVEKENGTRVSISIKNYKLAAA